MLDDNNSGLVIFCFLNIGLGIMVYAGLIPLWMLVMSIIFTVLIIYIGKRRSLT